MGIGNKNYRKGRRKEYSVIDKLRAEGCWEIVQRSKGSHSPVDIFAISKEQKRIKLIQVKPKDFSEFQENKILKENEWLKGKFEVEFEIA